MNYLCIRNSSSLKFINNLLNCLGISYFKPQNIVIIPKTTSLKTLQSLCNFRPKDKYRDKILYLQNMISAKATLDNLTVE